MAKDTRLVYSTDQGRIQEQENNPQRHGSEDGVIRIGRETKGRKGKGVTLVWGFDMDDNELKAFSKVLKQKCGTGGTAKDGKIEIQGDHRDTLVSVLEAMSYTVKRVGG